MKSAESIMLIVGIVIFLGILLRVTRRDQKIESLTATVESDKRTSPQYALRQALKWSNNLLIIAIGVIIGLCIVYFLPSKDEKEFQFRNEQLHD